MSVRYKVFIDGREGTTGLRIFDRLKDRDDIELMILPENVRKDPAARQEAITESDFTFLCLPDAAATEAAELAGDADTVIIDTSTAHRTSAGWAYGFPELSEEHLQSIRESRRIAVPGCHAGGFIALVYPLVKAGILPKDAFLSCFSITGYSGGGKKMIAEYGSEERSGLLDAPRQYALTQTHKHLKEMKYVTGIERTPLFSPIVADFYSGMEVTVPLYAEQLSTGSGSAADAVKKIYKEAYGSEIVYYEDDITDGKAGGFISALGLAGRDSMRICVCGNDDRLLLIAQYDNLGKGASGAAVECLNIKMGVSLKKGLEL